MTPDLTVFTASVRPDLAHLWLACVARAFPREETLFEIFDDSDVGALTEELLPGASILRPGPGRRDFQEAYNDVLARATTRWLALIDSDAYPVSRKVWPRVRARLEGGATAVHCAPRAATSGYDSVALVLDVSTYRAALADAPDGFLPRADAEGDGPGRWRGHDTGDLFTGAVEARGGRVEALPLEESGAFVRFDALTNAYLLAEWSGPGPILEFARRNAYFREGCLGNLALRAVHGRVSPAGPPFSFRPESRAVWAALARGGIRVLRDSLSRARRMRAEARRLEAFLRS